jgi:uncharacterized protein YkwD
MQADLATSRWSSIAILIIMMLSSVAAIGLAPANAYEGNEIGKANKYLMEILQMDRTVREGYYAMPISEIGDVLDTKLSKLDKCYDNGDTCFKESKSYNLLRSIYFDRLGETGPQIGVYLDQVTDAYLECQEQENDPEVCEYLHDLQHAVLEWATPKYTKDIQTYGWLIDDLLSKDTEEPIFAYDLDVLKQHMLDLINEDRENHGLEPVKLSDNPAAQLHAEEMLKTRVLSHWLTNGEKPYMAYSSNGGQGDVSQNIAYSGYLDDYEDCVNHTVICTTVDPERDLKELERMMIEDDKECCDDGHKMNILDPYHTHVSIGIAYDNYVIMLVQNFENNYVQFTSAQTQDFNNVHLSGFLNTATATDLKLWGLNVYYDKLPTERDYKAHKDDNAYSAGKLIAGLASDTSMYYEDLATIECYKCRTSDFEFDLWFDLGKQLEAPGVYSITMWVENSVGDVIPASTLIAIKES